MKHLLSSSAYLVVNKFLAKNIGLKPTILLADLISKESYFIENQTIKNGWFFNTSKNIERDTTLTKYQQKGAINKLVELEFIKTEIKGLPSKLHFKILGNKIASYLKASSKETEQLAVKKLDANKNKEIIINNNITFIDEVFSFDYPKEMLQDFFDYWTEPTKKGILRYELQKTWCTNRRLKSWAKRCKQFDVKGTSKIDKQLDSYNKAIDIIKKNYEN